MITIKRTLGIVFLALTTIGFVICLILTGCTTKQTTQVIVPADTTQAGGRGPFGNGVGHHTPPGQPHPGDPDQPHDN